MSFSVLLGALLALGLLPYGVPAATPKRGLIYIYNEKRLSDDRVWTQPGSDLNWYYNYGERPSPQVPAAKFQFVPMLWGTDKNRKGTQFTDAVKALLDQKVNVTHVLGFNEPDEEKKNGGSDIEADVAAKTWIREIEPLKKVGIKVGAPAVTGSKRGLDWLKDFFDECDGDCNPDFMPLHWYGDFGGMASFIGQAREQYPNTTFWFTEFALPNADQKATQGFFNQSLSYLEGLEYVDRISYFGSFRASDSRVGPNPAMLDKHGELTSIGKWYLGSEATIRKAAGVALHPLTMEWLIPLVAFVFWISF